MFLKVNDIADLLAKLASLRRAAERERRTQYLKPSQCNQLDTGVNGIIVPVSQHFRSPRRNPVQSRAGRVHRVAGNQRIATDSSQVVGKNAFTKSMRRRGFPQVTRALLHGLTEISLFLPSGFPVGGE